MSVEERAATVPDGLHLGLDEAVYHAIPALSSHQLMDLLRSPPDWHWKQPGNPLWTPPRPDEKVAAGLTLGKALHAWVLEGEAEFNRRYRLPVEEPEGLIKTVDDIKDWLVDHGGLPKPAPKNKAGWEQAARDAGCTLLREDWLAQQEDDPRTPISEDLVAIIKVISAQVHAHPLIGQFFQVGLPEATVVWSKGAQRYKARFDLLAMNAILDLKSFSDKGARDVRWSLLNEVIGRNYHMQAAWYIHARRKAQAFARRGLVHAGGLSEDQLAHAEAVLPLIRETDLAGYIFLFTKTMGAPTVYPIVVTDAQDAAIAAGARDCRTALRNYHTWSHRFEGELWMSPNIIENPTWPDRIQWPQAPIRPEPRLKDL